MKLKLNYSYLTLLLVLCLSGHSSAAKLSPKQARKLISHIGGAQLRSGSVHLKRIEDTEDGAEALAEIETAFRLMQDDLGHWQVAEIRTGHDQWEELCLLAAAAHLTVPGGSYCQISELAPTASGNLDFKLARCLLATILKIELPSDAIRIRDVSTFGLPLTSAPSAVVEALIQLDFRFTRANGKWQVSALRAGGNGWVNIENANSAIEEEKRKRALRELHLVAKALEAFHRDTGFYVVSDKQPVLIDHLSPRYLARILRLDPWRKAYQYHGERDAFELRSAGPDGKENTPDDIIVTGPSGQSSPPGN